MRNFRDRLRSMGAQSAMELPLIPGPDPIKMKALIGYICFRTLIF